MKNNKGKESDGESDGPVEVQEGEVFLTPAQVKQILKKLFENEMFEGSLLDLLLSRKSCVRGKCVRVYVYVCMYVCM